MSDWLSSMIAYNGADAVVEHDDPSALTEDDLFTEDVGYGPEHRQSTETVYALAYDYDGDRKVALRECALCGAAVLNIKTHTDYHNGEATP